MPGFLVSNLPEYCKLNNYDSSRCVDSHILYEKWIIERNTLNKFMDDKLFLETEKNIIIIEGVIYNKTSLINDNENESWEETVIYMAENEKETFFSAFEGVFSGAIYYKKKKKWVVFTGPLGEKTLFFYNDNNSFVVGSQLNYIVDFLKMNNISTSLDTNSINTFLGYGYYLDDSTCLREVKRLYPGRYIVFDEPRNHIEIKTYCIFDYEEVKGKSDDYWMSELDCAFTNAVNKILKKNSEYGYRTLIDISGGADSRLIAYTAKKCNAQNVLLDCYAQSESMDAKTSQKIAQDLGYDYIFMSLDNADCIMHIDENVQMTNGCTIYYGITGGKAMLESLDRDSFGLEITGLLGDVYDGSMVTSFPGCPIDLEMSRYRVSHTLTPYIDYDVYSNVSKIFSNNVNEHFWFYQRGMIFGMTSYFVRQNFLEAGTPFGDKDFLKVYLSIPWEKRVKEHLLRRWLVKYYPDASEYKYGESGFSLKSSVLPWAENAITFRRRAKKVIGKCLRINRPNGMNDFDYWYKNNSRFRNYIEEYIKANIHFAKTDEKTYSNINKLVSTNITSDKLLAVTMLSIINQYASL